MSCYPGMLVCLNLIFSTIPSSSYPSPSSSLLSLLTPSSNVSFATAGQLMCGTGWQHVTKGKHQALYIHQHPSGVTTTQASSSTRGGWVQMSARTLHLVSSMAASPSPSTPTLMLSPSDTDVVVNDTDNTGIPCHSGIKIMLPSKHYANSVSGTHIQTLLCLIRPQDYLLLTWMENCCDSYLGAFLCMEGQGHNAALGCVLCGSDQASYHCQNCFTGRLLCKFCMLKHHKEDPLHVIEVCQFFQHCRLSNSQSCLIRSGPPCTSAKHPSVQLGHCRNTPCALQ